MPIAFPSYDPNAAMTQQLLSEKVAETSRFAQPYLDQVAAYEGAERDRFEANLKQQRAEAWAKFQSDWASATSTEKAAAHAGFESRLTAKEAQARQEYLAGVEGRKSAFEKQVGFVLAEMKRKAAMEGRMVSPREVAVMTEQERAAFQHTLDTEKAKYEGTLADWKTQERQSFLGTLAVPDELSLMQTQFESQWKPAEKQSRSEFESNVKSWRDVQMAEVQRVVNEFQFSWKPKSLSERVAETGAGIPVIRELTGFAGGLLGVPEQLGHSIASFVGIPTIRPPPTVTGAALSSVIGSVGVGTTGKEWGAGIIGGKQYGISVSPKWSPEAQRVGELGGGYVVGSIMGEILMAYATGGAVKIIGAKVSPYLERVAETPFVEHLAATRVGRAVGKIAEIPEIYRREIGQPIATGMEELGEKLGSGGRYVLSRGSSVAETIGAKLSFKAPVPKGTRLQLALGVEELAEAPAESSLQRAAARYGRVTVAAEPSNVTEAIMDMGLVEQNLGKTAARRWTERAGFELPEYMIGARPVHFWEDKLGKVTTVTGKETRTIADTVLDVKAVEQNLGRGARENWALRAGYETPAELVGGRSPIWWEDKLGKMTAVPEEKVASLSETITDMSAIEKNLGAAATERWTFRARTELPEQMIGAREIRFWEGTLGKPSRVSSIAESITGTAEFPFAPREAEAVTAGAGARAERWVVRAQREGLMDRLSSEVATLERKLGSIERVRTPELDLGGARAQVVSAEEEQRIVMRALQPRKTTQPKLDVGLGQEVTTSTGQVLIMEKPAELVKPVVRAATGTAESRIHAWVIRASTTTVKKVDLLGAVSPWLARAQKGAIAPALLSRTISTAKVKPLIEVRPVELLALKPAQLYRPALKLFEAVAIKPVELVRTKPFELGKMKPFQKQEITPKLARSVAQVQKQLQKGRSEDTEKHRRRKQAYRRKTGYEGLKLLYPVATEGQVAKYVLGTKPQPKAKKRKR